MSESATWHGLRVRAPAGAGDIVVAWLWEQDISGVREEGPGCYVAFSSRPWEAEEAVRRLEERLEAAFPGARPELGGVETFAVEEEDWSRSWKEGWRPTPLGERLLVVPAWWEASVETDRSIVRIDPGTAFGTGTHATTRLAWELLEEAAGETPPRRFLDVGTGSGILALGLLRLQDTARGLGTERDEAALASLRVNLGLNPGSERFLPVRCGALPFREEGFDLAVANLTELELRAVEAALAPLLAPGGRIVLSGLLAAQGEDAGRRWEARGYRREAARSEEGWTAIRLVGERTRSRPSRGNNR